MESRKPASPHADRSASSPLSHLERCRPDQSARSHPSVDRPAPPITQPHESERSTAGAVTWGRPGHRPAPPRRPESRVPAARGLNSLADPTLPATLPPARTEPSAPRNADSVCCRCHRTRGRVAIVAPPPSVLALSTAIGVADPCSRGRTDFSSRTGPRYDREVHVRRQSHAARG